MSDLSDFKRLVYEPEVRGLTETRRRVQVIANEALARVAQLEEALRKIQERETREIKVLNPRKSDDAPYPPPSYRYEITQTGAIARDALAKEMAHSCC